MSTPAAGARRRQVGQPRPGPERRSGPSGKTGRAESLAAAKPLDLVLSVDPAPDLLIEVRLAQEARRSRTRQMDAFVHDARALGRNDLSALVAWLRASA